MINKPVNKKKINHFHICLGEYREPNEVPVVWFIVDHSYRSTRKLRIQEDTPSLDHKTEKTRTNLLRYEG